MKKDTMKKDHPEVQDIKNICDVSADSKSTKSVCDKIKKEKKKTPR